MSKVIRKEVNKIEIPKELHSKSVQGITMAKQERPKKIKNKKVTGILIAAVLFLSVGTITFLNNPEGNSEVARNQITVTDNGSVVVPKIQLPEETSASMNMIGLIVYNGNIYTQTRTDFDPANAKTLLGDKLGRTKPTIDEWSKQDVYSTEFASSIGSMDVYSVKGYDPNFRIMSYQESNNQSYGEFYENLNGITIESGEDIFGKLQLNGNVTSAKYRYFSDWNMEVENFHPVNNMDTLNTFIQQLEEVKPFPRLAGNDPLGEYRNDEEYRELTLILEDGSRTRLTIMKDGIIHYGYMDVYFKMSEQVFTPMWELLK